MSRTIEVTVLSAEDLRIDRKPVKRNAFVVVKIDPFNCNTTRPDDSGGSFPSWNEKFEMKLPMDGRGQYVFVEAFYRTSYGNDKKIGSARMPVADFMGGFAPLGYLHFLSYRLRDEEGDRNGIVNLSVRVLESGERSRNAAETKATVWNATARQQTPVFPPDTAAAISGFHGGVVTGIPVSIGHRFRP